MAFILQALSDCLAFSPGSTGNGADKTEVVAANVVTSLYNAEKGGAELKENLHGIVGTENWTENLAKAVLQRLEKALNDGVPMGQAMKRAFDKAIKEAAEFPRDHPVYCTLIALGILVVLAPWVLEALGFSEIGPVGGSFAAWWESTYAGYVPRRSLFAFFQRLGMVWRRKVGKAMVTKM